MSDACSFEDCQEPAIAGVSAPIGRSGSPAYLLTRRLSVSEQRGQRVCVHHVHYLLDLTLMRQAAR